ncbi:hypothetical protein BD769DRAFT_1468692 [Suillus cothurnatus]|nr:hypothetical protein BD769DRAFT_1468692 [Suillus cothurnatus]
MVANASTDQTGYHPPRQSERSKAQESRQQCVKGKETGTVSELYDLFESPAADMWPIEGHNDRDNGSDAEENEDNLGTQIAT